MRLKDDEMLDRNVTEQVQMDGIFTISVGQDTLDECPMAYKSMEAKTRRKQREREAEQMTWTKVTDALPPDGEAAPAEDEEDL